MTKLIDLTGRRFGRLTVVRRHGTDVTPSGQKKATWLCVCDCGAVRVVRSQPLARGESTSCGCATRDRNAARAHELTGKRFGRLVAQYRGATLADESTTWVCACDCGNSSTVRTMHLMDGITQSCGCLRSLTSAQRRWLGDNIGYLGMHDRLRILRGAAKTHPCVDCGERARDWSYNGGDEDAKREVVNGSLLTFSTKPEFYSPRCSKCHRRRDIAARRAAS